MEEALKCLMIVPFETKKILGIEIQAKGSEIRINWILHPTSVRIDGFEISVFGCYALLSKLQQAMKPS